MKRQSSFSFSIASVFAAWILTGFGFGLGAQLVAQQKAASDDETSHVRLDETAYQRVVTEAAAKKWIPVEATVRVLSNQPLFNVTFSKKANGVAWVARHQLNDQRYQELKREMAKQGFVEYQHRVYFINLQRRHLAYWKKSGNGEDSQPVDVLNSLWPEGENIPVSGVASSDFQPVEDLMLKFLREQKIPGATIAISFEGKIVYSRGFGYADVDTREKMEPDHMMRIASISKPVTATAVMRLVDQGQLKLDDPIIKWLNLGADIEIKDPRWREISVQQLLHHTAGFDRGKSGDPMFMPGRIARQLELDSPVGKADIIRFMLHRPLDFDPGTRKVYSNFGYCLLGRVIERASGKSYEDYLKREVLRRVGVTDMQLARSAEENLADHEVRYHTRQVRSFPSTVEENFGRPTPIQYGVYSIENMDAHGGWIASAPDLLKFAAGYDDPQRCPWMGPETVKWSLAPPDYLQIEPLNGNRLRYYAAGWSVLRFGNDKKTRMHFGALPGTASMLICRPDGFSWAVLFNCRRTVDRRDASSAIDAELFRAINQAKKNAGIR